MIKRTVIGFTVFCIVLSMLFSLAACGSGKNNASNNATNNEKTAETDPPKTKNNGKTLKPAETVTPSQPAETAAPIHTGETGTFIYDMTDIISGEYYDRLNETAKEVSLRDGCGIYIAIFENMDEYNYGSIDRFAKEVYDQWELGIDDDRCGILLVLSLAQIECDIHVHGELAEKAFGDDYTKNALLEDANVHFHHHEWASGIDSFINQCSMILWTGADATPVGAQSYSEAEPCIFDNVGLLNDADCQQLNREAWEVSLRYGCGVYISVFDDMGEYGFSKITDFAEEVFESWNLGIGEDRTCIILVMSTTGGDYDLYAHGDLALTAFTDYGRSELAEAFLDDFRNNDWVHGFRDYIRKCDEMLEQAGASITNTPANDKPKENNPNGSSGNNNSSSFEYKFYVAPPSPSIVTYDDLDEVAKTSLLHTILDTVDEDGAMRCVYNWEYPEKFKDDRYKVFKAIRDIEVQFTSTKDYITDFQGYTPVKVKDQRFVKTMESTSYYYVGGLVNACPSGFGMLFHFNKYPIYVGYFSEGSPSGYGARISSSGSILWESEEPSYDGHNFYANGYSIVYYNSFEENKNFATNHNRMNYLHDIGKRIDNVLNNLSEADEKATDAFYNAPLADPNEAFIIMEHLDLRPSVAYEGEMKNSKRSGRGNIYYDAFSSTTPYSPIYQDYNSCYGPLNITGSFKNDTVSGVAVSFYRNGNSLYVGEYKNGKQHGRGILFNADGSVEHDGYFEEGDVTWSEDAGTANTDLVSPSPSNSEESSWLSLTTPFIVRTEDLPIFTGPGSTYDKIAMTTGVGAYTIVEVSAGPGSSNGWGKLKSGAGWINLDGCSLN